MTSRENQEYLSDQGASNEKKNSLWSCLLLRRFDFSRIAGEAGELEGSRTYIFALILSTMKRKMKASGNFVFPTMLQSVTQLSFSVFEESRK